MVYNILIYGSIPPLRWPTTVTSNTNYSHQIQITHIKYKLLTSNTNYSHQIQIVTSIGQRLSQ